MAGRGILMAAGGAVPLTNTYVALHMLRNVHNCSLPVHIYYNGTGELDSGTRLFLEVLSLQSHCNFHHSLPDILYIVLLFQKNSDTCSSCSSSRRL